ncbi:CD209 antigen-like protein C [Saccostrea echinata]|uniref:CD209 antigen-like protein C n=1 Tax=Saccostrea echinata TaxID=191078 RepID=UPI002A814E71|nr:CD209 antigen-like protein C [Saccostrea echinata]
MFIFIACGEEWTLFKDYCYWFSNKTSTFNGAVAECIGKQSALVELYGSAEENWLRLQSAIQGYTHIWIGVTDLAHEGNFVFVSNNIRVQYMYSNWHKGEPGGGRAQNCAIITPSYTEWHDYPCGDKFNYVCKRLV